MTISSSINGLKDFKMNHLMISKNSRHTLDWFEYIMNKYFLLEIYIMYKILIYIKYLYE